MTAKPLASRGTADRAEKTKACPRIVHGIVRAFQFFLEDDFAGLGEAREFEGFRLFRIRQRATRGQFPHGAEPNPVGTISFLAITAAPKFAAHDLHVEGEVMRDKRPVRLQRHREQRQRPCDWKAFSLQALIGEAVNGAGIGRHRPSVGTHKAMPFVNRVAVTVGEDEAPTRKARLAFGVSRQTPIGKAGRLGIDHEIHAHSFRETAGPGTGDGPGQPMTQ